MTREQLNLIASESFATFAQSSDSHAEAQLIAKAIFSIAYALVRIQEDLEKN